MFKEHYHAARRLFNAREYIQAAQHFASAMKREKSDFAKNECEWWLGMCQAGINRTQQCGR